MIRRRDVDVERLPVGTRVVTPTGKRGTVIRHKGRESRRDAFMRVTVLLDGEGPRGLVTLQPWLLRKVQTAAPVGVSSWQQMEFEGWD